MKRSGRPFQSIGTRMRGFGRSILRSYLPPEQAASPEGAPPVPPPAWMAGTQVPLNWPEDAAPPSPAEVPFEEPTLSADEYLQQMSADAAPPTDAPSPRRPAQPRPAGQPAQRTPAQHAPRPAAPDQPVQRQPAPPRPKAGDSKTDARLLAILAAHQEQDAERERIREQRRKDLGDDIQRTADNPTNRRRRASFDYVETSSLKALDRGETGGTSHETSSKPPAADDDEDSSPAESIQRTTAETSEPVDAESTASPADTLRPDIAAAIAAAESPSGYKPPGAEANPPPLQRAPGQPAEPADADTSASISADVQSPAGDNPSLVPRSPVNDDLPAAGNEAVQRSADDDFADDGEVWADGPFDASDVDDSFELPPQASLTDGPSVERVSPPGVNPPPQPPPTSRPAVQPAPAEPASQSDVQREPARTIPSSARPVPANPPQDIESSAPSEPPTPATSRPESPVARRMSAADTRPDDDSPSVQRTPADTATWQDAPAGGSGEADTGGYEHVAYSEDEGAGQDTPVDPSDFYAGDGSPDVVAPPAAPTRAASVPPVQRAPAPGTATPPQDTSFAAESERGETPLETPVWDDAPAIDYSQSDTPVWDDGSTAVDGVESVPTWDNQSFDAPPASTAYADATSAPPAARRSVPPVQRAAADEPTGWSDPSPATAPFTDAEPADPGWTRAPASEAYAPVDEGDGSVDPAYYSSDEADLFDAVPAADSPPERTARATTAPPVQRSSAESDRPADVPAEAEAPTWDAMLAEDSYADADRGPTDEVELAAPVWQNAQYSETDDYAADEPAAYAGEESAAPAAGSISPGIGNTSPMQRTPAEVGMPDMAADASMWGDAPAEDSDDAAETVWQPTGDAEADGSAWQDTSFYTDDEPASYGSDANTSPERPSRARNTPPVQRTPEDNPYAEFPDTDTPAWNDSPVEDSYSAETVWQPTDDAEADAPAWQAAQFDEAASYAADEPAAYIGEESAAPAADSISPEPPLQIRNTPPVQRTPEDDSYAEFPDTDAPAWNDSPVEDSYSADTVWQPTDDAETAAPAWQNAQYSEIDDFAADDPLSAVAPEQPPRPAGAREGAGVRGSLPPVQRTPADAPDMAADAPAWEDTPVGEETFAEAGWPLTDDAETAAPAWQNAQYSEIDDFAADDPLSADAPKQSPRPAIGREEAGVRGNLPTVQRTPADSSEPALTGWQESSYGEANTTANAPAEPGMDLYEALMAAGAWAAERPADYTAEVPDAAPRADAAPVQHTPVEGWNTSDAGDAAYHAEQPASGDEPGMDVFQALMAAGALPSSPAAPVTTGRTGQPVQRTPADMSSEPPADDELPQSSEDAGGPEQSVDLYRALQAIGAAPKDSHQGAGSPPGSSIQRSPADDQRAELERLLDLTPPPSASRPAAPTVQPGVLPGATVQRETAADSSDDGGSGVDLDKLARDVYSVLRDRLRIERERRSKP